MNTLDDFLPDFSPYVVTKIEKNIQNQEAHLYLELPIQPENVPVGFCLHSFYNRTLEHLKLFEYRTFVHVKVPVYKNKTTGELQKGEVHFSRDFSRFTLQYEYEVIRLMKIHHCGKKVAEQLGLYPQRVENIFNKFTDGAEMLSESIMTENIGYDETSTRKGHEYITIFVNMDTHQIIGVEEGKSTASVESFYKKHPYPEIVKQISIDMSPSFISGAKNYFPTADITFDKWHVKKLLFKHLDSLESKKGHKDFIHYIRGLVGGIDTFYECKDSQAIRTTLTFIQDYAHEKFGNNPISKTIKKHFKGIVNYVESQLTNGILEGINSKIQTIKRVAKGFRSKENFQRMILFVFNYKIDFQVNS